MLCTLIGLAYFVIGSLVRLFKGKDPFGSGRLFGDEVTINITVTDAS
jgi:hypothetical protein